MSHILSLRSTEIKITPMLPQQANQVWPLLHRAQLTQTEPHTKCGQTPEISLTMLISII